MDFDSAVITINELLVEKQPDSFNCSWIRKYAPHVYRYIQKNVRSEIGGIDWDRVTRALDRRLIVIDSVIWHNIKNKYGSQKKNIKTKSLKHLLTRKE